ncbi:MAG: carbonic anhydrase [Candidatus Xenobia bacterium]
MSDVVQPSPQEALTLLKEGNHRFAAGHSSEHHHTREERRAVKLEQHPYAVLLCCSDSRVPPELIFDETLGRLFVVRVAGNVVTPVELGSIEFAVDHLQVPLIVVMGHERCGAVTAAVKGGHMSRHMKAIVKRIEPAVERARSLHSDEDIVPHAVHHNVREQMDVLHADDVLAPFLDTGRVGISGGVYHLGSGKVEWLPHHDRCRTVN